MIDRTKIVRVLRIGGKYTRDGRWLSGGQWFAQRESDALYFQLPVNRYSIPRWTSNLADATPFTWAWSCEMACRAHGLSIDTDVRFGVPPPTKEPT